MSDIKTEKLHARLKVRGIQISGGADFAKMVPWTRLTFSLCTAIAALATAFACTTTLWLMVPVALLGATRPRHPFDYIFNRFIRSQVGTIALPHNTAPTRFACGIAAVWFVVMALLFHSGYDVAGYILGAIFVFVGALVSITHLCIPGIIYQFLFGDRSLIKTSIFGGARV